MSEEKPQINVKEHWRNEFDVLWGLDTVENPAGFMTTGDAYARDPLAIKKFIASLLFFNSGKRVNEGVAETRRPQVKSVVKNPNGSINVFFEDKDLFPINIELKSESD